MDLYGNLKAKVIEWVILIESDSLIDRSKYVTLYFMKVVILDACQKEISKFPQNVKLTIFQLVSDLNAGLGLSMPIVRKMAGLGRNVF